MRDNIASVRNGLNRRSVSRGPVARAMRLLFLAVALLLPTHAFAGDDGPPPGSDSPPWDGETFRRAVDAATGASFDVPNLGFRLETRHFERKTPAYRVKDMFTLWGPNGLEVTIDIFDNPQHLSLQRFFETHLSFMREGSAAVSETTVGAHRLPALLVEQPKAPGAFVQPSTIFALNGRILRVTCGNEEDERAVKVYLRVLASLDLGKATR